MLERLTPERRNIALALLCALVLWFSWTVRAVLNPLVLGYLLAYIVHPLVLQLERRGWKRRTAVNLIFLSAGVGIVVLTLGIFAQGRQLGGRVRSSEVIEEAATRLGDALREVRTFVSFDEEGATEEAPGDAPHAVQDEGLFELLRSFWDQLNAEQAADASVAALRGAGGIWNLLRSWFGSLMALGGLLLLLPVYTYFLLFELDRIHTFVRRYIPVRERDRLPRIGRQVGEVLANFFRGRLVVCFLKGAWITVGLALCGVDYSLLLGMGSGFLSLVPFVGPMIGFVGATMVGFLDPELGVLGLLLRTAGVYATAELLEGYVLLPKILGDSLGLHPVVVLASVMVGGAALGMFGFLIALPLTAALVIVVRELVLPALADFADEIDEADESSASAT